MRYWTAEVMILAVITPYKTRVATAPAQTSWGELFETLDIIHGKS
jgi:hypothetical protein